MTTTLQELYLFNAMGQRWTYTSGDTPVTYLGDVYEPVPIGRSGIEQTQDINKNDLQIKFARDNPMALLHLQYALDSVISVTVFQRDEEGCFFVFWKGRTTGARGAGSEVTLVCESVFTSLRRPGLRARYQKTCRHALYSRGCMLDPEDFAVVAPVTAAAGNVVTVPAAALQLDGWYLGGMLRAEDGSLRLITAHAGSQLTLSRPIEILITAVPAAGYGLSYGQWYGGEVVVKIYPGCDRVRATCESKFDNLDNFGGFPWIPTKNPFGGSSIV